MEENKRPHYFSDSAKKDTLNKRGKLLSYLSRAEDILVLVFCLCMFCAGSYGLYDSFLVYHQANDDSILKFKPGYEGEMPEKEIKGKMVAWLTLEGTGIDYPVMQGDSNFEYLNQNPYGEYSLSGSIFLDCRNAEDFSDSYSLLYGHHMENGYMFGALDHYRKEKFFQEHASGTLIVKEQSVKSEKDSVIDRNTKEDTCLEGDESSDAAGFNQEGNNPEKQLKIRIIAVLEALATDEVIFSAGNDTVDYRSGVASLDMKASDRKTEEILQKIEESAIFSRPYQGNPLIAFSTCRYPDTAERTIVVGELLR